MVQIATLIEPYTTTDPLDLLPPIPYNTLTDTEYVITGIDSVAVKPSSFPVTPSAGGFLTDVDLDNEITFSQRVSPPYLYAGALFPESLFLESTIGQIWPR